jgi:hypothetical protein
MYDKVSYLVMVITTADWVRNTTADIFSRVSTPLGVVPDFESN